MAEREVALAHPWAARHLHIRAQWDSHPAGFSPPPRPEIVTGRYGPATFYGGEGGIRTPGRLPVNGFQDRRLQPLGHLSVLYLARYFNFN